MTTLAPVFGQTLSDSFLRTSFLKWQCRVRQIAMRDSEGRPDDAICPTVFLPGETDDFGRIITILNKSPGYSVTPEFEHMIAKTNDPAQRRDQAIQFLAATYYQKAAEFSDILSAVFQPGSPGAARLREAEHITLVYEAYAQRFELACKVWVLTQKNPLHKATMAHNRLFNPMLPADSVVLGFEPDWEMSTSQSGVT